MAAETTLGAQDLDRARYDAIASAHPNFVEFGADPGFRRYVAADSDRERILESGSAEEVAALVSAYPAYAEAERAHAETIASAHSNFIALTEEPGFAEFVDAAGARSVVDAGGAQEIIALLDRYVAVRPTPEQQRDLPASTSGRAKITADDSPREWHALVALLAGPKSREEIDRAAGVSNGPDLIMELRRRHGLACPCKRVNHRDRWGVSVKKGLYSLSETDRPKVARLLDLEAPEELESTKPGLPSLPMGNVFIDVCLGNQARKAKFVTPPSLLREWQADFEAVADEALNATSFHGSGIPFLDPCLMQQGKR
jgi:hypothetical protein